MSIHVVVGKPGSGKSMYATRRIIRELRETRRNIVTNVPLRPDVLNEYLQKAYPEEDLNMVGRLRMLSDDELRYFWKFRANGDEGPPELAKLSTCYDEDERKTMLKTLNAWAKTPTKSDLGVGVLYVLDEAHIAFNARAWASCADAALFYLSQHRKLGDQVWPITQAPGNLDKQFRSVAEDFTMLRNEYTAKYGVFRGRGRFTFKIFAAEPSSNSEPFSEGTFEIDKQGAAACYDTAKGIGVHGSKADIGARAKGIPILWTIPLGIAVASLCGLVPWFLGKGAGKFIGGKAPAVVAAPAAVRPTLSGPTFVPRAVAPVYAVVAGVVTRGNQLFVSVYGRGWFPVVSAVGGDALLLSDGSLVRRADAVTGGGVGELVKVSVDGSGGRVRSAAGSASGPAGAPGAPGKSGA